MGSNHYMCLDMLPLNWGRVSSHGSCDCAILLEIWDSGGLLQTTAEVPEGSVLDLAAPGGPVRAVVNSCTHDDYGCLIEISVDPGSHWFPAEYTPPYLHPCDAA